MQRCDAYVIYLDTIISVTLYDSDRKENCQIRSAPHSILFMYCTVQSVPVALTNVLAPV